jgi:hypothetical protein
MDFPPTCEVPQGSAFLRIWFFPLLRVCCMVHGDGKVAAIFALIWWFLGTCTGSAYEIRVRRGEL